MPYAYDPSWYEHCKPLLDAQAKAPKPKLHDIQARRTSIEAFCDAIPKPPSDPTVQLTKHSTKSADGTGLSLLLFQRDSHKSSSTPKPAVLYLYWGGMIAGSAQLATPFIARYCSAGDVPIVAVEYRRSPEVQGEKNIEDAFAALCWLRDNAASLNVDPTRLAIMGESAGGGIAAGLALHARDKGFQPPIAKQVLVYPMLDDQNTKGDAELEPFLTWSYEDNITGWTALLGEDKIGTDRASVYNVPSRAKDLSGLPPAYIDVGTLDIFCEENVAYAYRLLMNKVPVELHVYPNVPHAFELLAPQSRAGQIALENRAGALRSL